MRGRAQAIWQVLVLGAALSVTGQAFAQCSKDTDCKGDRVCDAGKCSSPLPPAPPAPPGQAAPAPAAPSSPPGPAATPPVMLAPAPGPTVGAPLPWAAM